MAAVATMNVQIIARVGSKDVEVGTLSLDVKLSPAGRIKTPSTREIKAALRKGLR